MAQSIICAVNIMNPSQNWKEGAKKALCTANVSCRTTAEIDFQMDFGMDLQLAYIHCATDKAQFYKKVLHKNHTL